MKTYRITVRPRPSEKNSRGEQLVQAAHQIGLTAVSDIIPRRLYFLQGDLSKKQAHQIAQQLLTDPVTETYRLKRHQADKKRHPTAKAGSAKIDVTLHPGVTDPAAENLLRTAVSIGYPVSRAATGQSYRIHGQLTPAQLTQLAESVLSNPVIQHTAVNQPSQPPFFPYQESDGLVETIPLRHASDEELITISQERRLSMNLREMQAIRAYYQSEEREPTDLELEMLAQTWSEHCVHKTFRAKISYTGPEGETETVDSLLKTYLRAATEQIDKPWVYSAFVDNAGIVAFTDDLDLAFKVETHNHPSALEPFGGANTGIGGVIRDILGVSARPIANTDVLCFGEQNMPPSSLPEGVLHPRRIQAGVIAGIEDYGNKMGIPTVNGAILYDAGYTANPLVYCGCLGILPHGSNPTQSNVGDLLVAIGGRTGRDGLRGATFSSMEMDSSTSDIAGTAVQIGNPIMEKQVQEVILRARDAQLYTAITDCGAGGFSSAVGEMSAEHGARIQLQDIKLKYPGLRPWEIWLSEAQERMVLAVPPENLAQLQAICAGQDVEATVLGHFTGDKRLQIFYGERLVGDLDEDFLHDGLPQHELTAVWQPAPLPEFIPPAPPFPPQKVLLDLLAHPNIRSKEDTIRLYDHEVQGATAVKPLVGTMNHGPSDAAVLVPLAVQGAGFKEQGSDSSLSTQHSALKGVALSNGICPQFTAVDPYQMAWAAIDEALRNAVAVGADPDQTAILDNFCWGNPNLPDRLGSLVRCAQGCYDAAVAYGTPYISGKDSLYNEYTGADGEKHAIPGTLLISALGIVPDVAHSMTMDFKQPYEQIYMIGITRAELAGSHYANIQNMHPALSNPPSAADDALHILRTVHQAIQKGLPTAVHDCSEGGLAVALAEMALAGSLGARVSLAHLPTDGELPDDWMLFSESLTRFLVTVPSEKMAEFEQLLDDTAVPYGHLGFTTSGAFSITGTEGQVLVETNTAVLDQAFRGHVGEISQPEAVKSEKWQVRSESPLHLAPLHLAKKVLILHANGTNRDRDAALACELAGGQPEIVHINQLVNNERHLRDYHMLVVPGGFSYGDDLGAGVLWAADLRHLLGERLERFVAEGRPVLGICNGFQVLVKAGLLSDPSLSLSKRPFTLTYNDSARFECRWAYLEPNPQSDNLFTHGLTEPIYCPVAHGEGRFAVTDEATGTYLQKNNLITLTYHDPAYPFNPNGSHLDIAGIGNPAGNVMGLMPHPEDHIWPWQHPRHHRGESGFSGLPLFINGLKNS